MKKQLFLICISALLLSSCSSRINNFSAQKYTHFKKGDVALKDPAPERTTDLSPAIAMESLDAPVLASSAPEMQPAPQLAEVVTISPKSENLNREHFAATWKNLDRSQKKEVAQALKSLQKHKNAQEMQADVDALQLICAIFIPPLGVYLHEGLTTNFWVDLILTLLFFIPGMIFAILVVTDAI